MLDVRIDWVRGDPRYGSDHIAQHGITEEEVEQVIFEIPPMVRAKKKSSEPDRTVFWGATRTGRWLFVSCEDWSEKGKRHIRPITAFEPENGEEYWRSQ